MKYTKLNDKNTLKKVLWRVDAKLSEFGGDALKDSHDFMKKKLDFFLLTINVIINF